MRITIATLGIAGLVGAAGAEVATQNFDDNSIADQITDNSSLVDGEFTEPGRTFDGTGLGWTLSWTDTRGTGAGGPVDGSESGDFIGVTDFTGDVGSFTSGDQGFQWNDGDGLITLSFDAIDASGITGLGLSFDRWVADTGFESTDLYEVSVNGTVLDSLAGDDLEAAGGQGWQTQNLDLSAFDGQSSVEIDIAVDTNSGSENVYIDTLNVTPAPAGTALLGLGGLIAARRRRA